MMKKYLFLLALILLGLTNNNINCAAKPEKAKSPTVLVKNETGDEFVNVEFTWKKDEDIKKHFGEMKKEWPIPYERSSGHTLTTIQASTYGKPGNGPLYTLNETDKTNLLAGSHYISIRPDLIILVLSNDPKAQKKDLEFRIEGLKAENKRLQKIMKLNIDQIEAIDKILKELEQKEVVEKAEKTGKPIEAIESAKRTELYD